MATHSSILAWKIEWTEEPGRLHTVHRVAKSRPQLSTSATDLRLNPFSPVPKLQSTRLTDPHASNPPVPTFVLHSSGLRFLKESEYLGDKLVGKGLETCSYTRKLIMRRMTTPHTPPCAMNPMWKAVFRRTLA